MDKEIAPISDRPRTLNGLSDALIVLSRRDVLDLLTLHDCIGAVEQAFRLHAEGRTLGPGVLGVPAADGGFHIKAAGLVGPERSYFAAKTNANFPENPRRFGLPTQHVLAAGLMTRAQVHAELADVVVGRRPGRTRDDEITVFDSSGTALQDVTAAVAVYEKARATGRGTEVKLDG